MLNDIEELLLNILKKYFNDYPDKLSIASHVSRNPNSSIWGDITPIIHGEFDFKKSMRLCSIWKRKLKKYFSLNMTEPKINLFKSESALKKQDITVEIKKYKLDFYESDSCRLRSLVSTSTNHRRYFLKEFNVILERKLEFFGINCSLHCEYNWFKSGYKNNIPFWRGKYCCETCANAFCLKTLETNEMYPFSILVECSNKVEFHEKKPSVRMAGARRLDIKSQIFEKGITNLRSEMINEAKSKLKTYLKIDSHFYILKYLSIKTI